MRTTLILDEQLLDNAREATGIKEKTALVHAGLKSLISVKPQDGWRRWAAPSLNSVIFQDAVLLEGPGRHVSLD